MTMVPENEIRIEFVRSSGPGGQNVNKTASKAQLRWCVGESKVFTNEQKELIRSFAGKRLNDDDEIVLSSQVERSQNRNRVDVIERLQLLVARALTPKKPRKKTTVSKKEKTNRLEEKRRNAERKALRRRPEL